MARIAGVNLPLNKRSEIGLTYIFGIGQPTARVLRKIMAGWLHQFFAGWSVDPVPAPKLPEDPFHHASHGPPPPSSSRRVRSG